MNRIITNRTYFLFYALVLCGYLFLAAYHFPLQLPPQLSATFGEFRDDHFHAGVDFKTYGRIGVPVCALADGYIVRMKDVPYGYGRAVYLQHTDGAVSVYAHLHAAEDTVHAMATVHRILKEVLMPSRMKYYFVPPHLWGFKKGETIAYSGETGIGFPHLHLTLKVGGYEVNPLNYLPTIPDSTSPVFQQLIIQPVKSGSMVNDKAEPCFLPVREDTSGHYAVRQAGPITIAGSARLEVQVYDTVNAPNKDGVYDLRCFIDGKLVYKMQCDKFKYTEDYHKGGLMYDMRYSGLHNTQYAYFCDRVSKTNMNFIKYGKFSGGVINSQVLSRNQLHDVRIEARDFTGNVSTLQCSLRLLPYAPSTALLMKPNITVRNGGILTNGAWRFSFASGAVFQDVHIQADAHVSEFKCDDPLPRIGEYAYVSPAYVYLNEPMTISFSLMKKHMPPNSTAVYQWDDVNACWNIIGAQYCASNNTLRAATKRLGYFAVFHDTKAPVIVISNKRKRLKIPTGSFMPTIYITDVGRGINDADIHLTIDGIAIPVGIDNDRHTIIYRKRFYLTDGRHRMILWAQDRAGNRTKLIRRKIISTAGTMIIQK